MALSKLTKVQTLGIGSNIEVVGVVTTGQFKSGTSNLHSTGIELTNLNVSGIATIGGNLSVGGVLTYEDVTNIDSIGIVTARAGVNVSGGQLDVGSNIKIGNAGVITATSFVGSGAGLTGITQTTINTNADNRIITGSGTANTLNGEASLTFNGTDLIMNTSGGRIFSTRTTGEAALLLGSSNAGGARLYLDGDSNGDWSGNDYAYIEHDTSGNLNIVGDNPANASDIIFKTNTTTERLRITSTGQLLISESSTDTTLNNWTGATINIRNTSNTDNNKSVIYFSNSAGGTDSAIQGIHEDADGTGTARRGFLSFGTSGSNSSGSVVERLRINSNGRVNIGDTNNTNNDLDYCRLSIYGQTSQNGTNKNLNLLNVYNYGSGNPGDITGIGLGAAASPDYTKASLAFIRTTSYGVGDLIFCINSEGNANMVTESDEKVRIKSDGNVIVGDHTAALSTYNSSQPRLSIYKSSGSGGYLELGGNIDNNGHSSGTILFINNKNSEATSNNANGKILAMQRVENVTSDTNAGDDMGGDLTFNTKPESGSLDERMRIHSTGYVTKSVVPCWNLRPRYNSTQTVANTSSHHAIGWGANGTANSNFLQNCSLEASGFTYNIHNGQNYGKLKVPVAGRYYVNVTYRVENNPTQGNIYVYVNNSQIARQHVEMWGHRPYMHCQYASVLNLAANDTILISVSCANANISGYNDNVNWFSGYLIG